jgi:hypothetical protein
MPASHRSGDRPHPELSRWVLLGSALGQKIISTTGAPASTVCARPILQSPFDYDGKPGRYDSGVTGLPTVGRRGIEFPIDTEGVVLPVGNHSYAITASPGTAGLRGWGTPDFRPLRSI